MKRTPVAIRYAKALFAAAMERKQLDAVEADLDRIDATYRESSDFRDLVDSPVLPASAKQTAFAALFEKAVQPLSFTFLKLLLSKRREMILPDVVADFRDLLDAHRGIQRGDLNSVIPLSSAQKQQLADTLGTMTGKTIALADHARTTGAAPELIAALDRYIDEARLRR